MINSSMPLQEIASDLNLTLAQLRYRKILVRDKNNPEFAITEFFYDKESKMICYKADDVIVNEFIEGGYSNGDYSKIQF